MKITRVVALLAIATLGLGACSSDSGESAASGSPSPSAAQTLPEATATELQNVLDEQLASPEFDVPGLIAGVWSPDGEWIGSVGQAGQDDPRAPQAQDLTRIGSLSKPMTVTLVLQLAEEGKVSMDDTIGEYVDGMPNGDTATLTDLAAMVSGIPTYTANADFLDAFSTNPKAVFTPEQLVDYVRGDDPMFKPGEEQFYSNTNTVLLGMVVEQVTGKSIEDVMQEKIFGPLKMANSVFPGESADIGSPHLSGITEQADPEGEVKDATDWNPSWGFTAGAVISNLEDLHIWARALGTGEGLIGPEMQQMRIESLNSDVPPNGPDASYGVGITQQKGWLGHTGTLPGYNTDAVYDPVTDTTIVVLANSDISEKPGRGPANTTTDKIIEVLSEAQTG